MKKFVLVFAASLALTGCSTHATAAKQTIPLSFSDIQKHWANSAIQIALRKGYVDGYENGTFQPDRLVSRAEFTKMVATALNLTVSGNDSENDWYIGAVNAAVNAGVHKWSDFTYGDWNTPMQRSEMSRMAVRAAGQDTENDREWMYLATKAGLIQGVDNTGSLDTEGTTTRAQAVTIIERILAVKGGQGSEIAKQADRRAISRAEVLWHKTNLESMLDGDYIDVANTPLADRIDLNKAKTEAYSGNLIGWAEGLYVIDLDDPNDPYSYLLDNSKIYQLKRIGDSVEATYLDIPNGSSYIIVCVSTVKMISNPDNINLSYLGTSYLSTKFVFDYGSTSLYDGNGNLAKNAPLSFFEGKSEITSDWTKFKENTIEVRKKAYTLPKKEGKYADDLKTFDINFAKFSSFGQYPIAVGKYKLHHSRM